MRGITWTLGQDSIGVGRQTYGHPPQRGLKDTRISPKPPKQTETLCITSSFTPKTLTVRYASTRLSNRAGGTLDLCGRPALAPGALSFSAATKLAKLRSLAPECPCRRP